MGPVVIDFQLKPAAQATWDTGGRDFVQYRDLGSTDATGGKIRFEHDRVIGSSPNKETGWHCHHLELQFLYVLKGWLRLSVHGMRAFELHAGAAAILPGGLAHDETAFSDDYEVLHILVPPKYRTQILSPPAADTYPTNQIILSATDQKTKADGRGWDLLCANLSERHALVAKRFEANAAVNAAIPVPIGHQFLFVLSGNASLSANAERFPVSAYDAAILPESSSYTLSQLTPDFGVLAIRIVEISPALP